MNEWILLQQRWPEKYYKKTFGTFCFLVVYLLPGIIVVLGKYNDETSCILYLSLFKRILVKKFFIKANNRRFSFFSLSLEFISFIKLSKHKNEPLEYFVNPIVWCNVQHTPWWAWGSALDNFFLNMKLLMGPLVGMQVEISVVTLVLPGR
jgi:hypothetical protein